MSSNLDGTPVPPYSQGDPSVSLPEERKGLLSDFDTNNHDNGELSHYKDEEYTKPQEHALSRKRRIAGIAAGFVALILGAPFLVPTSKTWCGGMGATSRLTDPSKLLSNGTHEFKPTVLILSMDGLR